MVALARSIVIPSAPCMRRCMGGRTLCCATTAELLGGTCLWSSCVLLRCQDLLGCRAISIATGAKPVVRHPLQPLARAALWTGMQRGMVHRDQMGRRSRCVIRGHRCEGPPRGMARASVRPPRHVRMSGALAVQHGWRAPAQKHWSSTLRGTAGPQAGGGPVTPNPPALPPGDPRPRLWSVPPGPQCRACAAAPSVSR